MPIFTLLTDFGDRDYYVAAVKGVLLARAPRATLVDISHHVAPGDVEGGSFLLAAAVPSFPAATIHLAVVDPGVGSARRMLAVRRGETCFVAPDNGLLTPFVSDSEVRAVEREDLYRRAPGMTFHGRDRFAPVAAALALGEPFERLGPAVDDAVRLALPAPRRRPDRLTGRIAHVDRFGNLVSDIPADWLPDGPLTAEVAGHRATRRVGHYAELPAGEPGMLVGSLGTLELSLDGDSLAKRWGVERGSRVVVDIG